MMRLRQIVFFVGFWWMAFLTLLSSSITWGAEVSSLSNYFPSGYIESRSRFRQSCSEWKSGHAETECASWLVPSKIDPDLTIDYLWTHPIGSEKTIVIVNGLHGVESFAGAALLQAFISQRIKPLSDRRISVLLVHSINPYGFKYLRRVTENGIDLNRNFPSLDFPMKDDIEANDGYFKLKDQLQPEGQASYPLWSFIRLSSRLLMRLGLGEFNLKEMHNAIAGGQHEFPSGLFYGGRHPEPQVEWIRSLFTEKWKDKKEIVVVDLHTGLGKKGVLHIMPGDLPLPKAKAIQDRLFGTQPGLEFASWMGTIEYTPTKTDGFYRVHGGFGEFSQDLAVQGQAITAFTLEFGTLGADIFSQLRSLNRMILENQGQQFGYSTETTKKMINTDFRELFFPSSSEWRQSVLDQGAAVFSQLVERF